jgi:molybdopterin converting factor subunit 1
VALFLPQPRMEWTVAQEIVPVMITASVSQRVVLGYAVLMRVRVLFFGVLKDVCGGERESVELVEGASVADLLKGYRDRFSGLAGVWNSIAVAVNQEYARGEDLLKEGDEVALLPPVSGGRWGPF